MVEFIESPLIVMDASKFHGKFTDGITVKEAVKECIENSPSENGSIRLVNSNSKGSDYQFGFNGKKPEDKYHEYEETIGNYKVLSIEATQYYMSMTFYVTIIFKEVN